MKSNKTVKMDRRKLNTIASVLYLVWIQIQMFNLGKKYLDQGEVKKNF